MKSKVVHALILAALTGSAIAAECGPDKLGVERTITLKREGALYGAHQHTALPLKKGEVVLTFDDGPVPEYTPMVLKALADQCTKATFFMIGERLMQHPQLAKRVVGEGNSAGVHSYRHDHMAALGADEQLADLKKTQDIYRTTFGVSTPAYRFPFLEETPTLLAALKQANVTVASIDFGINDWLPDDTTEILVKRLTESLDKAGKGIILMHDANIPTAKALPALLKVLKDKGYKVVHLEWEN